MGQYIYITEFGRSLVDDAAASNARTTLGLAAIAASGSASDLSAGTVPTARLGSGSASSGTYLRGDQTWAAAGGDTLPIADSTGVVKGSADPTKILRFEVDGFTAGQTRVATPPDANFTMARTDAAQTFTGDQTFSGNILAASDGGSSIGAAGSGRFYFSSYGIEIATGSSPALGELRVATGDNMVRSGSALIWLGSAVSLGWSSGSPAAVAPDARLRRSAASTLTLDSNGSGGTANLIVAGALTATSLNLGGSTLTDILTATASLNFAELAPDASETLTITVTGAAVGDAVFVSCSEEGVNGDILIQCWISAADTVSVQAHNTDDAGGENINLTAATFRATVLKF